MTNYALTLISGDQNGPLLPRHLDRVCQQLQLECKTDWLAADEACDLIFASQLSAAEITAAAKCALDARHIDAVCAPTAGRRKRLLISDMDSTIIDQECIDELGDAIGIGAQISEITTAVVNGEIGFPEALRQRVALMKGMDFAVLERVYTERITLTPGARTLVGTMRRNDAYCILVSGGFSFFTSRISTAVGFHDHKANELIFVDKKLTGEVRDPVLGRTAKLDQLNMLCREKGLDADDVLAVGDGANDIKMIQAAGLGVAFHAAGALKEQANACIDHADLTALLYLQGYRKSEFAPT